MSKLDGNERWKSKLLLTEHAEQYDQRHHAYAGRGITAEERAMIRDYILLPHMEKMVQRSVADLESSNNILKRLYMSAGNRIMDRIVRDLYKLRRELKQRNIEILKEEQSDIVIHHLYYCRGYEGRCDMTRDVMRAEISLRLTRYVAELAVSLKNTPEETV